MQVGSMTLSEHIESVRKAIGLTQVEMSNVMCINSKTYSIRIKGDGDEFTIRDLRNLYEYLKGIDFKEHTFIHSIARASMLKDDFIPSKNEYSLTVSSDEDGTINLQIKKA